MSHWWKRLIGLLLAVSLSGVVLLAAFPQFATTRQTANNVPAGELVAGRRLGQTFRAPFSGLYRVDVLLATYARRNDHSVTFRLSAGGEVLVTQEFSAAEVEDNAFRRFVFAPIPDSANREFSFSFEAAQAQPGNAITIWQTDFDSYPFGRAYVNDQPTDGDLAFVAYYHSNPGEVLGELARRVRTTQPVLWRWRGLVLTAVAAWVLGVGILLGELLIVGTRDSSSA